jgi:sigma-B regulation protein RsbU (phosphoserine phosphatase)
VAYTPAPDANAPSTAADRLRDIEAVTDAALSRLNEQALLDTLLDRVKKTLQVDTAVVLLLDQSARQLVATAASGIEEEVVQGVRVALGTGFAGRIAATREPVILTDLNPSTVSNPLLAERGIRSLLGVPLFVAGRVIGVLHVGSFTGREFTQEDAELLQLAADRAALALRSLTAQDDQLAAVALHRSLLPAALPELPGHELAARYVAGTGNVGGDWYDVFTLPDGRLGIVVGDVAGSGLQAAVIMGRMRSALRAYVLETTDPAVALRLLDRNIQYFEADAMATVLYGMYDPASGELLISSAGHPPPVVALPGEPAACALPVRPDPPIGAADDPPRQSVVVTIPPGGLLCWYTDGLVERRDRGIDVGIGLLAQTVRRQLESRDRRAGRPVSLADDTCAAVMRDLVGHDHARDDVAVLVLHRLPSG